MRARRWALKGQAATAWPSLWRHASRDAVPAVLAMAHGAVLAGVLAAAHAGRVPAPLAAAAMAVGLWWGSNTVAHIHLHTPLFHSRRLNRLFARYLTAVLGVPQSVWRARHLWHHAGEPADRGPRVQRADLAADLGVLAAVVATLAAAAPETLAGAWLPGLVAGLGLCRVHGHFEHAGAPPGRDPGVSCHHPLYNRIWLNDGFHAEHHRHPGLHWTRLPERRRPGDRVSPWPPVLRWIDGPARWSGASVARLLDALERTALASPRLQRWLVDRHASALRRALAAAGSPPVHRVCVIGGGLFPRTVLVLRAVLPGAEVTVLEGRADHIRHAADMLAQRDRHAGAGGAGDAVAGGTATFVHRTFDASTPIDADMVIVPLGFRGDRAALYDHPPARVVAVHDWLWRRRRAGAVVSPWLLKRLNVVTRA